MTLKIKAYSALCELKTFTINGVDAEYEDFGTKEDRNPMSAEPYCCADMRFIPDLPTDEVLKKYGITVNEYDEVCDRLNQELSFGRCGWCS